MFIILLLTFVFSIRYQKDLLKNIQQRLSNNRLINPKQQIQYPVCTKVNIDALKNITNPPYPDLKYHYTGYLKLKENSTSALGYMFYGAQVAKTKQELKNMPLIIWMNGGPGSSSQLGNFFQLGNVYLKNQIDADHFQIKINQFTWIKNYSVIFIDQPLATGLSVNNSKDDQTYSVAQSSQQLFYALKQLLFNNNSCFGSEFLNVNMSTAPLYIIGESYGGKYAPGIGSYIVKQNKTKFNLKGVAVGDGFTDPNSILLQLPQFASSYSFISPFERIDLQKYALKGSMAINQKQFAKGRDYFYTVLDNIVQTSGNVNVYDIRIYNKDNTNGTLLQTFLNHPSVKSAFGLADMNYQSGSDQVFENYKNDFMDDGIQWVQNIIDANISFMAYNGQLDMIVQTPGTLKWVENLNINNNWKKMDLNIWKNAKNQNIIGYYKQANKFRYLLLNQAGHLVPMDQPQSALQMVNQFIKGSKL